MQWEAIPCAWCKVRRTSSVHDLPASYIIAAGRRFLMFHVHIDGMYLCSVLQSSLFTCSAGAGASSRAGYTMRQTWYRWHVRSCISFAPCGIRKLIHLLSPSITSYGANGDCLQHLLARRCKQHNSEGLFVPNSAVGMGLDSTNSAH